METESMKGTIQYRPGPCMTWYLPRRRTIAFSHCCAMRGDCMATAPTRTPARIQSGLPVRYAVSTPRPTPARKTNNATMFPIGSRLLSLLHRSMRAQCRDDFVGAESVRVAFREHASGKRPQPSRVLRRRTRLGPARPHERPDAAARLEDSRSLEFAVHASDRVGVDLQFDRQFPHCGQLVADLQPARRDGRPQTPFDLRVDRRRISGIQRDDHCTLILVY